MQRDALQHSDDRFQGGATPDAPNTSRITPPTVIIVHPSERPSKCTVQPLRGRCGLLFSTFTFDNPRDLSRYVRLGLGGPVLTRDADAAAGLLILDATWRYAERMERAFTHVPLRSLPPCRTAYPRASKLFSDPPGGLATIEALYLAHLVLGRDVAGLLDHYHWRHAFLNNNRELIESLAESEEHRA